VATRIVHNLRRCHGPSRRMAEPTTRRAEAAAFSDCRGANCSTHLSSAELPSTASNGSQRSMDQSIRLSGGRLGFLLVHGLGGTPLEMRYVAQGLYHAGHTVHVPQLAGHCGSSDDLKATRWADWYATVEREHDRLKAHCDSIVVGGLSMGAILA